MRHLVIISSIIFICLTLISCTSSSTTSSDNSTISSTTSSDNSTTSTNETTLDNTTTSSGMFVAVGSRLYKTDPYCYRNACLEYKSRILTSSDNGITWNTNYYNIGNPYNIDLINNLFVITTSREQDIIFSEDAISWYYDSNIPRGTVKLAYGNGTYLAFNPTWYTFMISFDGKTWNKNTMGSISDGLFGNNIFVIGGNAGIYKSTDYGVNWTKKDSRGWITDISFGNNYFVATIYGGVMMSKDNGSTWYNSNLVSGNMNSIIYGSSKFVAVGDDGKIFSLADGDSSWIERTSGTTHDLNDVSYGNGTFVVVGDNEEVGSFPRSPSSVIKISDDGGVTWETKFTSGTEWQTSDGKTNRFSGVVFKE